MNSPTTSKPFDHVVLTAANPAQARGYEAQIRWRKSEGLLNPAVQFSVVSDPRGRRAGSAGATLNALYRLARRISKSGRTRRPRSLAELFSGRRILLCHSGGDSRRVPAYAAQGKIFTPLPVAGKSSVALFDLILANAETLPARETGHVVVMAGDVLPTLDAAALDFSAPGVVGVAYPAPLKRGSRHGVYVVEDSSASGETAAVHDFLQKPGLESARSRKALDPSGRVLVDTGILSLDPPTVGRLLTMAGANTRGGQVGMGPGILNDLINGAAPAMDLYEEFTMAMVPRITRERYLKILAYRSETPEHIRRLRKICRSMHGVRFSVNILPDCQFFHIGSSRELLANMSLRTKTSRLYGFGNHANSFVAGKRRLKDAFILNSIVESGRGETGPGVFIEGASCDQDQEFVLEGNNMLVGLPPKSGAAIRLKRGLGLVCLPIGRAKWAAVVFGINDDFKGRRNMEGCRFLNIPIETWQERHGIPASAIWPRNIPEDLWEARMWTIGSLPDVLERSEWMQSEAHDKRATMAWLRGRRLSMAQILRAVNHDRLIQLRREIHRRAGLRLLHERILADDRLSAATVAGQIRSVSDATTAFDQIMAAAAAIPEPLFKARALEMGCEIARSHALPPRFLANHGFTNRTALKKTVLKQVAEALARTADLPERPCPANILHDQVVWVTTPVRLDFAGGWSDTPPFCTEHGGTVLNAAITLNGQYPVQVMAKLNSEMRIRLSSIDLGLRREIRTTAEVLAHGDPRDWTILPKAALVLAGIAPGDPRAPLRRWLKTLGGGIDLTIFSAVPKGSGLGTSSILGAAVLACLLRIRGEPIDVESLIKLTSLLEQRMNTGGGWQDQVGGIIPHVKLIRTNPGLEQTPSLYEPPFTMGPGSPFGGRMLLYFTGQKRLARDILHNIVHRYLARDPQTLLLIEKIKALPLEMNGHLESGDVHAFARGLDRYWALKKQMDPGATNARIEAILNSVDRWTLGRCLAGAGGGGFILFIARSRKAALSIRRHLETHPPNPHARFFDFVIDDKGLAVTVL